MKKVLIALAPWMAAIAAAQSEGPFPAEVVFTHFGRSPMPAWQIGMECFVPADAVSEWGWTARLDKTTASIQAEGKTLRVPYRYQAGRPIVALGSLVRQLGGSSGWKVGTRAFHVWGHVRAVHFEDEQLSVETSLAAKPRLSFLEEPDAMVLDFDGMKLDPKLAQGEHALVKWTQHDVDTVRVVVRTSKRPAIAARSIPLSTRFSLNLRAVPENPGGSDDLGSTLPPPPPADPRHDPASSGGFVSGSQQEPAPIETAPAPEVLAATVEPPKVVAEASNRMALRFSVSSKLISPPQIRRLTPHEVLVTIPGARYKGELQPNLGVASIRSVRVEQGPASTQFFVQLAQPMGMELSIVNREITLTLIRPKVGDGKLSSKTVVIDAGHGGHDGGAQAPGGSVQEKHLALAIAKLVAEQFTAEGATVIMTRKSDVFIPLKERAMIANRNGADFFISVHINSSKSTSSNGGMTFYHKSDPIGQLLAECIQTEIAKVSGLRSLGAWSDGRIYDTGFAVLRYSTMPCVLIECGFINNSGDRARMLTPTFQNGVASAVVKGVKVFLGNVED